MQTSDPLNARQRLTIQISSAAVGAAVIGAMCILGNDSRVVRYFVVVLGSLAIIMAFVLAVASSLNRQIISAVLWMLGIVTGLGAALLQYSNQSIFGHTLWVLTAVLLSSSAILRWTFRRSQ